VLLPAAAAYRPNVIPHTSLSALWCSRQSTRRALLYVQSKSQSLGCDHRLKNTHKTAAARPHKPLPANRTTTHESDTLQNLTKGPSAARCRHAAEAMPSWQKCCSWAQNTATARLPMPAWPKAPCPAYAVRRAESQAYTTQRHTSRHTPPNTPGGGRANQMSAARSLGAATTE
jgi:hypothetical protein